MGRFLAVVAVALMIVPSTALAADPPKGADISDSLEYIERVPDSGMIVEGKLDRVKGKQVLLTTGRYGFRTYDVSDPAHPWRWTASSRPRSWARTATCRTRTCRSIRAAS